MKMTEKEFLELLKRKTREAKLVAESGVLPDWLAFLGRWLGENPWRVIGLMAMVVCGLGRWIGGAGFREGMLRIFGGF